MHQHATPCNTFKKSQPAKTGLTLRRHMVCRAPIRDALPSLLHRRKGANGRQASRSSLGRNRVEVTKCYLVIPRRTRKRGEAIKATAESQRRRDSRREEFLTTDERR